MGEAAESENTFSSDPSILQSDWLRAQAQRRKDSSLLQSVTAAVELCAVADDIGLCVGMEYLPQMGPLG